MGINFQKILKEVIQEDSVSGGPESVFGPGVGGSGGEVSGDTYATGDNRAPYIMGGIYRRTLSAMTGKRQKRKNKKKRKKQKSKLK